MAQVALEVAKKFSADEVEWKLLDWGDGTMTEKLRVKLDVSRAEELIGYLKEKGFKPARVLCQRAKATVELVKVIETDGRKKG